MVIAAGHILNVSERKIDGGVVVPHEMIDNTPIDANFHYAYSPCDAVDSTVGHFFSISVRSDLNVPIMDFIQL